MTLRLWPATLLALVTCCTLHAARSSPIKGPPLVWGAVPSRQTFRLGDTIKLDCPIRANPAPILEWSKDGDSIKAGWERYKPTNHGLRIRQVLLDDSGLFTCRAVNGFGSQQVTYEVLIVDPNAKATEAPPPPVSVFSDSELTERRPSWSDGGAGDGDAGLNQSAVGRAPLLIETSQTPGRIWQLPVESTLRLKCLAQGQPEPHLIWIKDGREIGDERRHGRWELQVPRVALDDSGTYTCRAVNPYGSMNASFIIQVIDRTAGKPEFVGGYPQNVTVLEGSTARLQCRVTSDTSPFLQWLRRLEPLSPFDRHVDADQPDRDGIIFFDGWKYQVLRSGSPAYQADDGSYLDKLSLTQVTPQHAGVYICVATNSVGYTYRSATVAVFTGAAGQLETRDGASGMPTAAVIGLPVGGVAAVLLIGWIVYYVRSVRGGSGSRASVKERDRLPAAALPLSLAAHHQRHGRVVNKDVSAATPCLPRGDQHDAPVHHRMAMAANHPPPPTYHPYSTPYMGSIQQQDMLLSYQPELVRMHNVINGGRQSLRPPPGGSPFRDSHNNNANTWSNMYRSQPCGRSSERNPSLASFPGRHDSGESEHAYASVHNMNVNYAAFDYEDVRSNNRRFIQRIDMV